MKRRQYGLAVVEVAAAIVLSRRGHPASQAFDDPRQPFLVPTGTTSPSAAADPDGEAGPGPSQSQVQALQPVINQVQREDGTRSGVVVHDENTGKQSTIDAGFPVRSASSSNVGVAMARLRLATTRGMIPTDEDYQLIHDSLAYSDNVATQAIFQQLGNTHDKQCQALLQVYWLLGMDGIEESAGWGNPSHCRRRDQTGRSVPHPTRLARPSACGDYPRRHPDHC